MSLFLADSGEVVRPYSGKKLAKGQLYNLDLNDYMNFQFNPNIFEWERSINWKRISSKGDDTGGDLQYINTSPRAMDLILQFVADPYAPDIEYQYAVGQGEENELSLPSIGNNPGLKMNFRGIRHMIERWEEVLPGPGRPSRIKVIIGDNVFNCVIKESHFRCTEFFGEDLSVREAIVTLSFEEWIL